MTENHGQLFPASPRVVYEHAPLIEVICQLRFPTLLKIEAGVPDQFQEEIRAVFPLVEQGRDPNPVQVPTEFAQLISQVVPTQAKYNFMTVDRTSTVTLTPSFLALTSTQYKKWEIFREHLHLPLNALIKHYQPSFFSRIGLRYKDAIDRNKIGMPNAPWSDFVRSEVLGELAIPEFEASAEVVNKTLRFKLQDASSVSLRHGLAQVEGHDGLCYLIDLDLFTEAKTEVTHAGEILDRFNLVAGRAFRWCITDKLRDALKPTDLPGAVA